MALSHSPRRVIPLSSGEDYVPRPRTRTSTTSITKRVFFCGVVVEGSEGGREIPQDVQDLLTSLGDPLEFETDTASMRSASDADADFSITDSQRRTMTNSSALADIIKELVVTERSYVNRLKTLKNDYADPLRQFARSKDTAILPPYEAKTLFGNIDSLVPVNEAFLQDLERMGTPDGLGVGEVALKHFKMMKGFEHYKQYYAKREEAQTIFKQEVKKSSGFAAFIDRVKYSSADTRNRVGLRELLMEPVQRIPRYTLMFRTMMKHMAPDDPQSLALQEADEIASRIALAETDEQTKRASILYCLSASIEDFPPALFSHGRRFIDCIDVEDVMTDVQPSTAGPSSASKSGDAGGNLHCTLFLFDDKLMIVKRPGNGEKSGRALAGLDDFEKMAKGGGRPTGRKRTGMSCKGLVDVTDVAATDIGGVDMHLYLEAPPLDMGDRWSGRPFRALSVVQPGSTLDFPAIIGDKQRFLENLWDVQGKFRTKKGQSVVLCQDDTEVENKGGKVTFARTYFNVYTRSAFLLEAKKTKVVLQIDPLGTADPIPFGMRGPPLVIVKVQPLDGELCRYKVMSNDPTVEDEEEDIVQSIRVPERIVHTIHQYGLFKFRTGRTSMPSTPTATARSRAAIFGLDAISRNIFTTRPGSAMGDIFGGTSHSMRVSGHRRARTHGSRSSMFTDSTLTGESAFSRFSRTGSSLTNATSIMDDESIATSSSKQSRSRSLSRAMTLVRRHKSSKGEFASDADEEPERYLPSASPSQSRSTSEEPEDYSEYEEEVDVELPSERDLRLRLELARRNSQNQSDQQYIYPSPMDEPIEDTIYEEDPSTSRPFSRAGTSARGTSPAPSSPDSRSRSRNSERSRPAGPRSPSPLPPSRSPSIFSMDPPLGQNELGLDTNLVNLPQTPAVPRAQIPRSKRQPFVDATPRPSRTDSQSSGSVKPLSIKKSSGRARADTSPSRRSARTVRSSSRKSKAASADSGRPSKQGSSSRIAMYQGPALQLVSQDDVLRLVRHVEATKEDIESSRRAVKRIRLEGDKLRTLVASMPFSDESERPGTPFNRGLRPTQLTAAPLQTREAQARFEEMRQLIEKRSSRNVSPLSPVGRSSPLPRIPEAPPRVKQVSSSIEELVDEADRDLSRAVESQDTLQSDLHSLAEQLKESTRQIDRTFLDLQSYRRQCDLVKDLLHDCMAERDVLYEAFNEELDGMFNDASLPQDEAWVAMTQDLRRTKEARNQLTHENSDLKRRLAEVEMQNEEWGALLRQHGLIP
ncbi:hypothetical protein WOLCODRAFT_137069 [Wolfiporia cocos MD-104 SS10]|uniref:DH domain-containing protein n=1 Tax=Wolfiporia cocos (strain MD-104) TaxID=742152 RepID=A0A2H3JXK8_WOLCO|nr:hypothetical protein WOLCODRAFT_137069 [Wolfiporia cocos MD-104 SS10]